MKEGKRKISRRRFLQGSAAVATATIVPRHVLGKAAQGGGSQQPPSETLGGALIGCGGRGGATFDGLGRNVRKLAMCDVRFKDKADDKTDLYRFPQGAGTQGYRRGGDRHPPRLARPDLHRRHGSGQGRALRKADVPLHRRRRGRGRGRAALRPDLPDRHLRAIRGEPEDPQDLRERPVETVRHGAHRARRSQSKEWSGKVKYKVERVPANLDWDMYCGPAPCGHSRAIASAAPTAATGTTRAADCRTWPITTSTGRPTSTPATSPRRWKSRLTPRRSIRNAAWSGVGSN